MAGFWTRRGMAFFSGIFSKLRCLRTQNCAALFVQYFMAHICTISSCTHIWNPSLPLHAYRTVSWAGLSPHDSGKSPQFGVLGQEGNWCWGPCWRVSENRHNYMPHMYQKDDVLTWRNDCLKTFQVHNLKWWKTERPKSKFFLGFRFRLILHYNVQFSHFFL